MAELEPSKPGRSADPLVSVVVPVLNEAEAIPLLLAAIAAALGPRGIRHEVVFVDDGSTDASWTVIRAAAAADPRIRAIALSRRFGKEAALSAGLEEARGDVVVPMDADLQDPPALLPVFLDRWRDGYDVVYGQRTAREDGFAKRVSAGWFYRLFNRVTDIPIPPDAGDFRLLDRRVVDVIRNLPERNRFMKGLFAWVGFRAVAVPYERPGRSAGGSKWRLWRLWNFALDGVTAFSTAPLRVWTYAGGVVALLAFLYAVFIVVRVLILGIDLPGYPSLMAVVLFLGGVQLISLGVIGEYLGRLVAEAKRRPLYVVAERVPDRPGDR
jgi:glycosyltransferase involved in cell wall biosynthesis